MSFIDLFFALQRAVLSLCFFCSKRGLSPLRLAAHSPRTHGGQPTKETALISFVASVRPLPPENKQIASERKISPLTGICGAERDIKKRRAAQNRSLVVLHIDPHNSVVVHKPLQLLAVPGVVEIQKANVELLHVLVTDRQHSCTL